MPQTFFSALTIDNIHSASKERKAGIRDFRSAIKKFR